MKRFLCLMLICLCAASASCSVPVQTGAAGAAATTITPAPTPTPTPTPSPSPTATPSPTPTPTPTPTPVPTPSPTPVDPALRIISAMSDDELLGQMVLLGFTGTDQLDAEVKKLFDEYKVGGAMLFGWNVKSFAQTKKLTDALQAENPTPALPLLIGIDEEGGIVSRLPWSPGTTTAAYLGRKGDAKAVYDQFLRIGKGLKDVGVNLDFAPVLDVAPQLDGTFLGNRMYGTDPDKVITLTNAAIKGLHDAGVFSLGKHFPGHGETATDSHSTLPVIHDTLERLNTYTLKTFRAAVDTGVDAMLVGHLKYPVLDPDNPASLSEAVISGLLRDQMGFQGVVVSDDMRMGAITSNYDIGEACVRFIEAGGDIAFIGKYPDKQAKALAALREAVHSGRIPRDRLLESAYRIVKLKLKIQQSFGLEQAK